MTNARLLQPKTLRGPGLKKLRAEVLRGLRATQKYLPCKYFYDDHGSALFEQITELPEYYLTRTELAIMKEHAAAMAELLGSRCLLLEYGSGSSAKTRLLLDQMHEPVGYVPVDVSGELLQQTARDIAKSYPALEVIPVNGDFTRRFHV